MPSRVARAILKVPFLPNSLTECPGCNCNEDTEENEADEANKYAHDSAQYRCRNNVAVASSEASDHGVVSVSTDRIVFHTADNVGFVGGKRVDPM